MNACGAKTNAGSPCKRAPLPNGRCNLHGGKTPSGIASPNFHHGRYSKALPSRLSERYQDSLRDPNLLAQREEIALMDSRIGDVLGRIDTGESGAMWSAAQTAYGAFRAAMRTKDQAQISEALHALDITINEGVGDAMAWRELFGLIERRRKLVESERKQQLADRKAIAVNEVLAFAAYILSSVKTHVSSPEERALVAADIHRLCLEQDQRALAGDASNPD